MSDNSNAKDDCVVVENTIRKGPTLKKIINRSLLYWKWILASVVFFVLISVLYIVSTTPEYLRSTAVAIKEDSDGNSTSRGFDLGGLSGMGFLNSSSLLENEIAVLESPDLMEEVVSKLHLNVNYNKRDGLRKEYLYGTKLPIEVIFADIQEKDAVSLKISVNAKGKILLTDMKKYLPDGEVKYKNIAESEFNKPVKTPIGTITVCKTAFHKQGDDLKLSVSRTSVRKEAEAIIDELELSHKEKDGTVVKISIKDPSIERGDAILSTLIDCYNEDWIAEKNAVTISTIKFINERLITLSSELGEVDSDISSYKSSKMIPIPGTATAMAMEGNQATVTRLMELSNQMMMTKYLKEFVEKNSQRDEVLPVNTGINNSIIEAEITAYNNLILSRRSLSRNGIETHPMIADLDERIKVSRAQVLSSIDNQIRTITQSVNSLKGYQGDMREQMAESPEQSRYLISIGREQKVKENLYVFLLQKREENELSQAYTTPNTRMIRRPYGKNKPVWPRPLLTIAVGFFMGIMLPVSWIYFKLSNEDVIQDREDLKNMRVAIVGEIPLAPPLVKRTLLRRLKYLWRRIRRKEDVIHTENTSSGIPQSGAAKDVVGRKGFEYQGILVRTGARDVVNEAFRVLRTNLRFMRGHKEGSQALSITSFSPGSGKTFVTVNLGCALALKGAKVILIDADMRRATLSTYAGSPRHGLSDYLSSDKEDLGRLIKKGTDLPEVPDSLDLLPAGTIPPNPTELLENGRLEELMLELKKTYDYVLIDCPPAEVMADARLIDEVVDRTIFVIRYGLLDKSFINLINELYSSNQYSNLSVILNGSKVSGGRYGNRKSYGSYSGYSY